jgi:hypothetical protein
LLQFCNKDKMNRRLTIPIDDEVTRAAKIVVRSGWTMGDIRRDFRNADEIGRNNF